MACNNLEWGCEPKVWPMCVFYVVVDGA